jgi:serine/threonine protein kinase
LQTFRTITKRPVWDAVTSGNEEDFFFERMISLLGPPPQVYITKWENHRKFVDSDGKFLASYLETKKWMPPSLDEALKKNKPLGMNEAEQNSFADFLRMMLAWEPEKRSSAEDLLKHEWINKYAVS